MLWTKRRTLLPTRLLTSRARASGAGKYRTSWRAAKRRVFADRLPERRVGEELLEVGEADQGAVLEADERLVVLERDDVAEHRHIEEHHEEQHAGAIRASITQLLRSLRPRGTRAVGGRPCLRAPGLLRFSVAAGVIPGAARF